MPAGALIKPRRWPYRYLANASISCEPTHNFHPLVSGGAFTRHPDVLASIKRP